MLHHLTIAFAFMAPLAVTPLALLGQHPPGVGPVLVLLAPWADGPALVEAAGGHIIGPARAPFALLAAWDTAGDETRALKHGAWAVLDGNALAAICGVDDV